MIFYILDTFPNLTETFIVREILALKKQGIKIRIFAHKKPDGKTVHPETVTLQEDVIFLNDFSFRHKFTAIASTFFSHPALLVKLDFTLFFDMLLSPRFAYHRFRGAVNAMAVAKYAKDKPVHIHAHFAYVTSDTAGFLAGLSNCKWSVSAHAWDIFTQPSQQLSRRLKNADRIFVCSKHGQKCLEKKVRDIHDKTVLMYHGVDTAEFAGTGSGDPILSVGRLEEKKGFEILLQAAKILSAQGIEPQIKIVGDGPLKTEIEKTILDFELKNIKLTGSLAFDEVKKLMSDSSMLVQPSIVTGNGDHDGIPNVLLEAMAFGKPVITTDVGGITELVENGKNGVLFEAGDPEQLADRILDLLDDKEKAAKIGKAGTGCVKERFEISENIKPIMDYFKGFEVKD